MDLAASTLGALDAVHCAIGHGNEAAWYQRARSDLRFGARPLAVIIKSCKRRRRIYH